MAPMKFRLTSPFGALEEIRNGQPHTGIDLAMPEGTPLRSVIDGVVERVVNSPSLGKGVIIRTDDGTQLIYGHMSKVSVKTGDHVGLGDLIGLSGNTGNSTGAHLHFGMMHNGEWVDPTPLADTVSQLSGSATWKGPLWLLGEHTKGLISGAVDNAKEAAKEAIQEQIYVFLRALGEVTLDLTYGITLIGCAVLIILKIAGLKDGYRYAGVLFMANALIRLLLGGVLR